VRLAEVLLVAVIVAAVGVALFAASQRGDAPTTAVSDPAGPAGGPDSSADPGTEAGAETSTDATTGAASTPEGPQSAAPPPQTIVHAPMLKRSPKPSGSTDDVRDKVERLARKAARAAQPAVIRVGSFNVLGSQHTAPGGDKGGGWPSGAARLPGAIERIKAHGVSVVGLQEVQPDQLSGLVNGTGFAEYPGAEVSTLNRVNSILYDPDVFQLVSGSTFMMSNGMGERAQPIVRLRHIATGRELYVVNAHPPAGHSGALTAKRAASMSQLVGVLNGLKQQGLPILVTGDMNDREAFVQRVINPAGLVSSTPTSGRLAVDWVVGTQDVAFSDYVRDASTISRRISDHFFVAATATIG
jgi:endonuclease/exonuclease/phosphatase family metal-dependent hydrolase